MSIGKSPSAMVSFFRRRRKERGRGRGVEVEVEEGSIEVANDWFDTRAAFRLVLRRYFDGAASKKVAQGLRSGERREQSPSAGWRKEPNGIAFLKKENQLVFLSFSSLPHFFRLVVDDKAQQIEKKKTRFFFSSTSALFPSFRQLWRRKRAFGCRQRGC
mgnify:CR=1|jgi:hypothetical protein